MASCERVEFAYVSPTAEIHLVSYVAPGTYADGPIVLFRLLATLGASNLRYLTHHYLISNVRKLPMPIDYRQSISGALS